MLVLSLHIIWQHFIDLFVFVHISSTFISFTLTYLCVFFLMRNWTFLFVCFTPGIYLVCVSANVCSWVQLTNPNHWKSWRSWIDAQISALVLSVLQNTYAPMHHKELSKISEFKYKLDGLRSKHWQHKDLFCSKVTYIKIVLFCFNVSCFQVTFIGSHGLVLVSHMWLWCISELLDSHSHWNSGCLVGFVLH